MSRYYCMLDTQKTLPSRVVINIGTKNNVAQAVAENLNPKMTHDQRVEHAKKEHSDYIERVWIRHYDPDYEMEVHLESSELIYNDQLYVNNTEWLKVKPHQWKKECDSFGPLQKHLHVNLDHIKYVHRRYHVSPGLPVEHIINTHIKSIYVKISPEMYIQTHSKRCDFRFKVKNSESLWKNWTGCLIEQSDDNKRDNLKQIYTAM